MKKGNAGFTLIEILIVIVITSFISLSIYAATRNGMEIWQRVNQTMPEEDLNIFLESFTVDVVNSVEVSGLDFLGGKDKLIIPTLVVSSQLKKRTIGDVSYYYNSIEKTINRRQRDFSQLYNDKEGLLTKVVKNIEALSFFYYRYDEQIKEAGWEAEWEEKGLPLAIRIELDFNNGRTINKFVKTVNIPVSH